MGHTSYKTTIYNDHRIALNFRVHCSALSTDPLHHPHSQQGAFKFSPAPPPGRAALMGRGGGGTAMVEPKGSAAILPSNSDARCSSAGNLLLLLRLSLKEHSRPWLRAWHRACRTMVQRPRCFVCDFAFQSQVPNGPTLSSLHIHPLSSLSKLLPVLTLASVHCSER